MSLPDSISFSGVGGNKLEYSAVVDTSTDRSAAEVNTAFACAAAISRTTIRAWVKFNTDDAEVVTVTAWDAVWKEFITTPPTVTLENDGKYLVTFPATVLDEQGVSHSVNLNAGWVNMCGDAVFGDALFGSGAFNVSILTANTVRIWYSVVSTPSTPASSDITLFVI